MIAKRMIDSLRRQDWTMVAIEFVLVVVGVLFAFQINEWAQRRSEARASREAMQRLLDESERDIAYLRLGVQYQQQIVGDLHYALHRIKTREWQDADVPRMERGLSKARYMVSLAPPVSIYEDVVASGALNNFDDPELRAAVSAFHSTLSFEERARQHFEDVTANYEKSDAFTYLADPQGEKPNALQVDFGALSNDRSALKTVALVAEDHRVLLSLRKQALNDSIKMCEALAKALNQQCNRNRPPPKFG
jgi:hypothetical protein